MIWSQFRQEQKRKTEHGELFTNMNSRGKTFIRANWGAIVNGKYEHDTKTFDFNIVGYKRATAWLNRKEQRSLHMPIEEETTND